MNIIAVDDEKSALNSLQSAINEAVPNSQLSCFNKSRQALEFARSNQINFAFLDIEMGGMNGLQLAKHLKEIYCKTIIVFVTGYSEYALDAFALHAGGYLLKPVTSKAITEVVEHFHSPVQKQKNNKQPVFPK